MANSALICTNSENICRAIISSASFKKFANKSRGEKLPSSRNKVTEISGVVDFWKSLRIEGISSNAAKLISNSKRKNSTFNYELAWGEWTEKQVNPFQASVNYIINFLSKKFDKELLQCKTLDSFRSDISANHVNIGDKSVGKHSKVCAFLTCIFNQRPPQHRYVDIWHVDILLQNIRTH